MAATAPITKLRELWDVDFSALSDGQELAYDAPSDSFKNVQSRGRAYSPNNYGQTSDAAVAINQALAAAAPSGAKVELDSGRVYDTATPVVVPSSVELDFNRATIRVQDNANCTAVQNADLANGNPGARCRNGTIDGNKAHQSGDKQKYGVHFVQCANGAIEEMEIHDVDGFGAFASGNGQTSTRPFSLRRLYLHDCGGDGIWGSFALRQCIWDAVVSNNNGGYGAVFDASEQIVGKVFCRGNALSGAWVRNVFSSQYNELICNLNGQHGILVDGMVWSTGNQWSAHNNSVSNPGAYNDVHFRAYSGQAYQSYGISAQTVIAQLQAGPSPQIGATTEGYAVYIEDYPTGWGDVKLYPMLLGAGTLGLIHNPAVGAQGFLVAWDFPVGTQNTRQFIGVGIAAPSGIKIPTSAAHPFGAFGHATAVQPTGTPAAATDLASVIALANDLRAKQLAEGWIA